MCVYDLYSGDADDENRVDDNDDYEVRRREIGK